MPTLLLSARQTDDTQSLWRACISAGWEVVRVHGWRVPQIQTDDLAVYGEPLFAHHVAQSLNLKLLEPPLDWLPMLPPRLRGRDLRLTTLAEARKTPARSFIKPAAEKCFDAKVYLNGSELPAPGVLPDELPVLVQDVVDWQLEFRCFILKREVLTHSPYWRDGRLAKAEDGSWPMSETESTAAKEFCQRVLADNSVKIPEAVVLDVGIIRNIGWAVIESNAAFSSGIYGCDPAEVLQLLRYACAPR